MTTTIIEETWDFLIESGIATENELILITTINGYNEDSLNDVLYARTGSITIEKGGSQKEYPIFQGMTQLNI